MHEMSLCTGLLDIIKQEMEKHHARRLVCVRVRHGSLANIVPEALSMAFEVLTVDTELEGARLEMVESPVTLACGSCGVEFVPESSSAGRFAPCAVCGEELGHNVLTGRELYLEQIEVE
jgi:Zn finger protein HypA/HybF (possibly regulating hydrogenase expression)